jgi:protein-L-isoaspartate(D-aspartate) O-methyltransferase
MSRDYPALRKKMVREQLIPRGIKEPRLLQAIENIPRHKFVPAKYAGSAYEDFPLPIGAGQTISQPYMVALMTQCLELSGKETVLEIGTGSGYQTAILAELAGCVYSIERVAELAEQARMRLAGLGYGNIRIKADDGSGGWQEHAPYERIIVTAAAPRIPEPLVKQLKVKGKLVIPIGGMSGQTLTVCTKYKNKIETEQACGCVFVPLLGKYGWRKENA